MGKRIRNSDGLTVTISAKEIMEKLDAIHDQTQLTNGRVTNLEKKSLGMWISNNPGKFLIYSLIFIALVISDIRHPMIALLTTLI